MNLVDQLEVYLRDYPEEKEKVSKIKDFYLDFVDKNPSCFDRSREEGHFTASAFAYNKKNEVILLHHKKLDKWLQPGGHADGESNLAAVAKKELFEETNINANLLNPASIFDVDVHLIPENKFEKEHFHFDVRFLFSWEGENKVAKINEEANSFQWIHLNKVDTITSEDSILRMVSKLKSII